MKRATLLLSALGLILVLVAWYLMVWSPRAEAITEAETQILDVQAAQSTTRSRIVALQSVREQAPKLQAELAAAESLLPRDTALPSALRQLQVAADDSLASLVSVSPSRPELVEGTEGLYAMGLNAELRGTYFQIIDTLRRLEDPAISPRGFSWSSASITIDTTLEAPNIIVALTGRMFAVLPSPPAAPEAAPVEGEADAEAATDDGAATDDTDTGAESEEVTP